MPYRKIKVDFITDILHLPGGQRIIIRSSGGPLRVLDLDMGTQVEEWEARFSSIALSPDGKTLASGSWDGALKLWSIDTGKVIKTLTGHTERVFVCWSPDGGRVLGRSMADGSPGTFRVWDVKSGETILGPIRAGLVDAVHYSPDGKMIAATDLFDGLKIWDANTGKLLKTLEGEFWCLAWTSNGKTLTTWGAFQIMKFDTATWTVLDVRESLVDSFTDRILPSPDGRLFATAPYFSSTLQLWNIETNQPIGTLHHEAAVNTATFSADGKFLFTSCDRHIYIWDVSAILVSDIDVTPRPAPGAPRIPPGFFDDALREANSRIRLSQSHGPHNHSTPTPRQRTLSSFSSFWRRSRSHGEFTRPLSHSLNWTRNLVSGMLRRRDGSDIELREVEVPYTAGKPRNYHARKKPTANSSRPPKIHTTQNPNSSSSQLPPTTTTSTLSAAGASGTPTRPHITVAGWRARFVGWICCMPIQNADGHH